MWYDRVLNVVYIFTGRRAQQTACARWCVFRTYRSRQSTLHINISNTLTYVVSLREVFIVAGRRSSTHARKNACFFVKRSDGGVRNSCISAVRRSARYRLLCSVKTLCCIVIVVEFNTFFLSFFQFSANANIIIRFTCPQKIAQTNGLEA